MKCDLRLPVPAMGDESRKGWEDDMFSRVAAVATSAGVVGVVAPVQWWPGEIDIGIKTRGFEFLMVAAR